MKVNKCTVCGAETRNTFGNKAMCEECEECQEEVFDQCVICGLDTRKRHNGKAMCEDCIIEGAPKAEELRSDSSRYGYRLAHGFHMMRQSEGRYTEEGE